VCLPVNEIIAPVPTSSRLRIYVSSNSAPIIWGAAVENGAALRLHRIAAGHPIHARD
jgi:hypothetical protein